jgi:hypothetical protein
MSFLAPINGRPVRLLTLFGLALLLTAAACGDDDDAGGSPTTTDGTPTPTARETRTAEPTLAESVCGANPDPATVTELRVATPARGDSRTAPLEIFGTAGTAPAVLRATLYGEAGAAIAESATVGVEKNNAQFSLSLDFSVAEETPACLWVYKVGEGDSPENVVQIALVLATEEAPRGVCGPNPEPAARDVVRVDEPGPEDHVSSPLTVSGGIVLTSGELTLTLYDEDGGEIAQETGSVEGGQGELAPFSSELAFEVSAETVACLWVWEAADGTAVNVAQVPVTLQP